MKRDLLTFIDWLLLVDWAGRKATQMHAFNSGGHFLSITTDRALPPGICAHGYGTSSRYGSHCPSSWFQPPHSSPPPARVIAQLPHHHLAAALHSNTTAASVSTSSHIVHRTGRLTDSTPFSTTPQSLQSGVCGRNPGKPPSEAPPFTPAQIAGIVIGAVAGLMGASALAHRLATARLHRTGDALDEAMAKPFRPRPVCAADMCSARNGQ